MKKYEPPTGMVANRPHKKWRTAKKWAKRYGLRRSQWYESSLYRLDLLCSLGLPSVFIESATARHCPDLTASLEQKSEGCGHVYDAYSGDHDCTYNTTIDCEQCKYGHGRKDPAAKCNQLR